jgi:hypothetical protein
MLLNYLPTSWREAPWTAAAKLPLLIPFADRLAVAGSLLPKDVGSRPGRITIADVLWPAYVAGLLPR